LYLTHCKLKRFAIATLNVCSVTRTGSHKHTQVQSALNTSRKDREVFRSKSLSVADGKTVLEIKVGVTQVNSALDSDVDVEMRNLRDGTSNSTDKVGPLNNRVADLGDVLPHHPRGRFAVRDLPRLGSGKESLDSGPDGEVGVKGGVHEAATGETCLHELEPKGSVSCCVEVVEDSAVDVDPSNDALDGEDATVDHGREDDSGKAELSLSGDARIDVEIVWGEGEEAAVVGEEVPLESSPSGDSSGKRRWTAATTSETKAAAKSACHFSFLPEYPSRTRTVQRRALVSCVSPKSVSS